MFRLKIKEIAASKGISQSRLSRLSDVDPKAIRRLYQNPGSSVSLYILDRIATALQVDIQDLIETIHDDPS